MPLFAHGIYHAPFNGPSTSATYGDSHFVMAWQAIQFSFQLPGISSQLLPVHEKDIQMNTIKRGKKQATMWLTLSVPVTFFPSW